MCAMYPQCDSYNLWWFCWRWQGRTRPTPQFLQKLRFPRVLPSENSGHEIKTFFYFVAPIETSGYWQLIHLFYLTYTRGSISFPSFLIWQGLLWQSVPSDYKKCHTIEYLLLVCSFLAVILDVINQPVYHSPHSDKSILKLLPGGWWGIYSVYKKKWIYLWEMRNPIETGSES